MKRLLAKLSSYYFIAIFAFSVVSFLYSLIFYPIERWLEIDAEFSLSREILDSSLSAVELILLLPEIIITGLGEFLGIHLGFYSMLHWASNFARSQNFVVCEFSILIVGLCSLYLWRLLSDYAKSPRMNRLGYFDSAEK